MTAITLFRAAAAAALGVLCAASAALAEPVIGQSAPGQLDIQEMVTPVGRAVGDLHHLMLYIVGGITLFVLALLLVVIVRYNAASNPKPASWTHNTMVEVIWTAAPVVILVVLAIPSVQLLRLQEDFTKVEPDVVIKTTGYQWYWGYSYAKEGIEFDATMIGVNQAVMSDDVRNELAEYGYPETAWKLATDYAMVVPVNKTVLMEITASDVIHSWTIPAFAVKGDGVPGRINRQWFKAEKEGIYFGQCSELCGRNHAYMPITVKVVSQEKYDAWVACVQEKGGPDGCDPMSMNELLASRADDAAPLALAAARVAQ